MRNSAELRQILADPNLKLCKPQNLRAPEGLPTGWVELDAYLPSRGLPVGELVLFQAPLGVGATRVWLDTAKRLQHLDKNVVWVEGGVALGAQHVFQQGLALDRLLLVRASSVKSDKMFWLLQELITSQLFCLLACEWQPRVLRTHQILKLKRLAHNYRSTLVFFAEPKMRVQTQEFGLVLEFQKAQVSVLKSRFVPTPRSFFLASEAPTAVAEAVPRSIAAVELPVEHATGALSAEASGPNFVPLATQNLK